MNTLSSFLSFDTISMIETFLLVSLFTIPYVFGKLHIFEKNTGNILESIGILYIVLVVLLFLSPYDTTTHDGFVMYHFMTCIFLEPALLMVSFGMMIHGDPQNNIVENISGLFFMAAVINFFAIIAVAGV